MRILKWFGIFLITIFAFVWIIASCFYYFNDYIKSHFDYNLWLLVYSSDYQNHWENSTKYEITKDSTELNLSNETIRKSIKINNNIFWNNDNKKYRIKITANNGFMMPESFDKKTNVSKRNIFYPKFFINPLDNFYYVLESEPNNTNKISKDCMYINKFSQILNKTDNCINLIIPKLFIDNKSEIFLYTIGEWNFSIEKELLILE